MAWTATGVFEVMDKATKPMKSMRSAALEVDKATAGAGKQLQDLGGSKVTASLDNASRSVGKVQTASDKMAVSVKRNTDSATRDFDQMSRKVSAAIAKTETELKVLSATKATPSVDLDIRKAEAKLRLLREQLRQVDTTRARKELDSLGLTVGRVTKSLAGGGAGGGGPGRTALGAGGAGGKGGLAAGFMMAAGAVTFMSAAVTAALPAVVALSGAISALIGSLGAAAIGGGALAIGTGGPLVVGLAAIVSIAKPAIAGLKQVATAQQNYNKVVAQYGAQSAQAVKAHRLLVAEAKKDPGALALLNNKQAFTGKWKDATKSAQGDFFGILNDGIKTGLDLLPTFSNVVNGVMRSTRAAADQLFKVFRADEFKQILTDMGRTFQQISGPAASGIGHLIMLFARIAEAASPEVVSMFNAFDKWTGGLDRRSRNVGAMGVAIHSQVGQLKAWVGLFRSAIKLAASFFGAGASQGGDMVASITDTLNKWTDWVKNNPEQVQNFFSRTIDSAGKLVRALGTIGTAIAKIADELLPVLNIVTGLFGAMGPGMTQMVTTLGAYAFTARKLTTAGHQASKVTGGVGGVFSRVWTGSRSAAPDITAPTAAAAPLAASPGAAPATGPATANAAPAVMPIATGQGGVPRAGEPGYYSGVRGVGREAADAFRVGGVTKAISTAGARVAASAGGLAKSVGRVAGPMMLLSGIFGAIQTKGSLGQRLAGGISSATFGLIPGADTYAPGEIANRSAALSLHAAANPNANTTITGAGYWGLGNKYNAGLIDPTIRVGGQMINNPLYGDRRVKIPGGGFAYVHPSNIGVPTANTPNNGRVPTFAGIDPATDAFTGKGVSRGLASRYVTRLGGLDRVLHQAYTAQTDKQAKEVIQGQIQAVEKLRDAYKGVVAQANYLSKIHGQKAFNDLIKAFGIRTKNEGIAKATDAFGAGLTRQLAGIHNQAGKTELLKDVASYTSILEKGNKDQRAAAKKMRQDIVDQYKGMGKDVRVVNGNVIDITNSTWKSVHALIGGETEKALEEATTHFTKLQLVALDALKKMGFSGVDAANLIRGLEKGGVAGTRARSDIKSGPTGAGQRQTVSDSRRPAAARGMRVPGVGTIDSVPIMAAPGELIVNRHTERKIDERLGVRGAMAMMVNGEKMPHNLEHFASGGRVGINGGVNMSVGSEPRILADLNRLATKIHQSVSVISGYRTPAHSVAVGGFPNDPHTRGQAADIAVGGGFLGSSSAEAILRSVGLYRPFYPADPHEINHVQLLGGGPSGSAGGRFKGAGAAVVARHLKALHLPPSALGGVPGALSTRSGEIIAAGMTQKINKALGKMGGGADFSGLGGGGTSGANQALGRKMMLAMGWPASQWPALKALWTRESGWNQNARNPSSGAYGIPQALGHGNVFGSNPKDQIAWGLNYIKGRYGSPAGAWAHEQSAGWYAKGGRVPSPDWGGWYGQGGSFTAHKPTLIGVGERGKEHVTVTPDGQQHGSTPISIRIGKIVNHEEGDIQRILERELKAFARHLTHGPIDDEDELG